MSWVPPWLAIAFAEKGVREFYGEADNPRIVEYHETTSLKSTDDEVPWCSSFVNWCMSHFWQGTDSARARSWLRWGTKLDYPALGCVTILTRGGAGQSGPEVIAAPGHVGFFLGFTEEGRVRLWGGNQSNSVCESSYPAERVLGYRWPA